VVCRSITGQAIRAIGVLRLSLIGPRGGDGGHGIHNKGLADQAGRARLMASTSLRLSVDRTTSPPLLSGRSRRMVSQDTSGSRRR
jgi:hypothetical protein